jgi:hypothetical protein
MVRLIPWDLQALISGFLWIGLECEFYDFIYS